MKELRRTGEKGPSAQNETPYCNEEDLIESLRNKKQDQWNKDYHFSEVEEEDSNPVLLETELIYQFVRENRVDRHEKALWRNVSQKSKEDALN